MRDDAGVRESAHSSPGLTCWQPHAKLYRKRSHRNCVHNWWTLRTYFYAHTCTRNTLRLHVDAKPSNVFCGSSDIQYTVELYTCTSQALKDKTLAQIKSIDTVSSSSVSQRWKQQIDSAKSKFLHCIIERKWPYYTKPRGQLLRLSLRPPAQINSGNV